MKNNINAESVTGTPYHPEHLGRRSQHPVEKIDRIPWQGGEIVIELQCDEFTSMCPVTCQPDFGSLEISYTPAEWLVETKSLKLYLWQFRDRGVFNEELITTIARDLYEQLAPKWLKVKGRFNSRGGIAITATVTCGTVQPTG